MPLMAHGDLLKGAEKLAPRFAAGPLKAIREGTEGVTTASNQPVYYGNEKLRASMLDVAADGGAGAADRGTAGR